MKDSPALAAYPSAQINRPLSDFFSSFCVEAGPQRLAMAAVMDWTKKTDSGEAAGLVLWSRKFGVGKTHLAKCAREALSWSGKRGSFYTAPDWLEYIKSTYNSGPDDRGTTERYLFREWAKGYFILDDFGKQYAGNGGEWAQEKFFKLLDKFYENRSLLITSNFTPEQMSKALGGAAWSRLYGMCRDAGFVSMDGLADWRAK